MANKKQVKVTKKSNKQSWLRKSIDISTRKGQFIVFIFIFAVIGGGYAVYSTYAASQSFDFYPGNISFYNETYGTVADINDMSISTDYNSGSKSAEKVAQIPASQPYAFQIRANQNLEKKAGFDVWPYSSLASGFKYKICVDARTLNGSAGKMIVQIRFEHITGSNVENRTLDIGTVYSPDRCITTYSTAMREGDRIRIGTSSNHVMNVRQIIITKL